MSWPTSNCRRSTGGECLEALQEAKHSLLSVAGVSPMQLVFGRNPAVPVGPLQRQPDVVANSSILSDRGAERFARVSTIARNKSLCNTHTRDARRAPDTRPRVVLYFYFFLARCPRGKLGKVVEYQENPLSPNSPLSQNKSSQSYTLAADAESLARAL